MSLKTYRTVVDGGRRYEDSEELSAGSVTRYDEQIPPGGATLTFPVDVSELILLKISYPEDVTLEADTLETYAFQAASGLLWTENDPAASKPFTQDVATLTVPNSSDAAQRFLAVVAQDPTPT